MALPPPPSHTTPHQKEKTTIPNLPFNHPINMNLSLVQKHLNAIYFSNSMAPSCNHSQNVHQLPQEVVVVVVPFPAQGHLNQLLHFSRLISSYNIPIHYITTTTHSRQVNFRAHGFKSTKNIQFHEFPTPIFTSPAPRNNPNNNSSINKFPSHLQPCSQISTNLRNPVAKILRALSHKSRRIIIIHDSLMGSVVQDYRAIPNAEAYTFHSVSAFTLFLYVWESLGKPFFIDSDMIKDLPSIDGCFSPEFNTFVRSEHEYSKFNSGKIYNTSRVIEGHFLDLLSKEQINKGKKQWALGPFNPITILGSTVQQPQQRHKSLTWLDKQVAKSVIFVSFGTTTSFSHEQINEIAMGLEQSQQKFIWVLRGADKENAFSEDVMERIELPKGFEEKVRDRGIVVTDWAPQLEILAHSSTGGFLSHCGWNSCMESISMGVPLATWPMHSDQPRNAVLITKILKIGLVIKDWAQRDELVLSNKIEKVVTTLMASKEGEVMRKRAQELSFVVKKAVGENGVTKNEFDSFIAHITRGI
ncbi:zeatin O-glucosyltransferase-like [Capsicum chacoense]